MRIAGIVRDSVVDGVGIRDVIFTQGCGRRCKGCHNPHTWDYNGGVHKYAGHLLKELEDSDNDITISGGEPLDQFYPLLTFLELVKNQTNKRVWLYTGNKVNVNARMYQILSKYVDVVVEGEFIEELKDSTLQFRGSSNQRIIDLPSSIDQHKIVLWEDKKYEV